DPQQTVALRAKLLGVELPEVLHRRGHSQGAGRHLDPARGVGCKVAGGAVVVEGVADVGVILGGPGVGQRVGAAVPRAAVVARGLRVFGVCGVVGAAVVLVQRNVLAGGHAAAQVVT